MKWSPVSSWFFTFSEKQSQLLRKKNTSSSLEKRNKFEENTQVRAEKI